MAGLPAAPISLTGLVPSIEEAINRELAGVSVKIDDAILTRASDGPGVLFRLRNIRLVDANGAILAQAPLAAIGMSGSALSVGAARAGKRRFHRSAAPPDPRGRPGPVAQLLALRSE